MSLLETYENMKTKAAEDQLNVQRWEVINEYAKFAAEKLEENFPGQWTQEDQLKLASALIEADTEESEKIAHVENIKEAAVIFAREAWDEWSRLENQ